MQDSPHPDHLLAAVAGWLRDELMPQLAVQPGLAASAYQARVAANLLDLVGRQLRLAPATDAAECQRLQVLLAANGLPPTQRPTMPQPPTDPQLPAEPPPPSAQLAPLNQALAEQLAQGRLGLDSPGLADHLWATTLAKLAVDQPGYDTYRRATAQEP